MAEKEETVRKRPKEEAVRSSGEKEPSTMLLKRNNVVEEEADCTKEEVDVELRFMTLCLIA